MLSSLQLNSQKLKYLYSKGLPSKLREWYNYAANFVQLLKSRTPKVIMKGRDFKAYLMEDGPFNSATILFNNGVRIEARVQSSQMILVTRDECSFEIDCEQNLEDLGYEHKMMV